MTTPEDLLSRLNAIGSSLESTGRGIALLGLGSVGEELERLDGWSDLDFFAIVQPGSKAGFLDDLSWLAQPCPIAYAFRNTPDGHKLLYEDGIFCEMAVFEPAELAEIPFAPGRIVWSAPGTDPAIRLPVRQPPAPGGHDPAWLLGEALTCLYVGLMRFQRGELLSAQRFIQHYVVDKVIALWEQRAVESAIPRDPFTIERRVEQRCPDLAPHLPDFVQGYLRSRESAAALLRFIERHWEVNPAISERIAGLCDDNLTPQPPLQFGEGENG